jgi:hypothetical protein
MPAVILGLAGLLVAQAPPAVLGAGSTFHLEAVTDGYQLPTYVTSNGNRCGCSSWSSAASSRS